jgi:hypothetical protein
LLKMLKSSSKSEFINFAGATPMCIDRHLPGRLEDRLRTQALPVLDVERPVHFGNSPVPFHHEDRLRLFRASVHHLILPPDRLSFPSESCLIQDEPGEGNGFSHKMSLEELIPHAGN